MKKENNIELDKTPNIRRYMTFPGLHNTNT